MVSAATLVLWNNWPRTRDQKPVPTVPISIDGDATLGDPTAKVVIIEYSDFQCPFCNKFVIETFPGIRSRLIDTKQVRWVFKHLPIEKLHPQAVGAAEAAECARRQNRFWPIHDQFFAQPKQLQREAILAMAADAGSDMTAFSQCLDGEAQADVAASIREAQALGITGTPTFLVGIPTESGTVIAKERLSGFLPAADFEDAVASAANAPRWPWFAGSVLVILGGFCVARWRRTRRVIPASATSL